MINSINITGVKFDLDETTKRYVIKKIGRLDRYLPRHARKSATAEVKLRQVNKDHANKYEAEVIMHIPDKTITAKDSTVNVLAALDIVEAKIVAQLHKYKENSIPHVGRRGVLARFKRSYAREAS
ncbi:ribosomal subunit interface protein [Candidatus Saccharibacteria bacterium RIFCSPHIGHO2_01_FULL_45_15]|nr:MAG: ribosomal subunit interface protein [Candidatus Saccharibacteria bacterium RIFCSPHIGHO2_01_FULL_45_15]OGL28991.1 MAG: ribosomal subunit interface protein [Candidatus Saccharibacteria bacterium RIFCSPHIGHO2_02_FULL_46_12]OGL32006.1 MAG: ribosomal subunit interface protein [Candidatus Saccharibacteria bacterium RIFCSPHIGHO2_12_FULL_44_22]